MSKITNTNNKETKLKINYWLNIRKREIFNYIENPIEKVKRERVTNK